MEFKLNQVHLFVESCKAFEDDLAHTFQDIEEKNVQEIQELQKQINVIQEQNPHLLFQQEFQNEPQCSLKSCKSIKRLIQILHFHQTVKANEYELQKLMVNRKEEFIVFARLHYHSIQCIGHLSYYHSNRYLEYYHFNHKKHVNQQLLYYHCDTPNKSCLIMMDETNISKFDSKKQKWIKLVAKPSFIELSHSTGFIDNDNGKLYLLSPSVFAVFDIEKLKWNFIKSRVVSGDCLSESPNISSFFAIYCVDKNKKRVMMHMSKSSWDNFELLVKCDANNIINYEYDIKMEDVFRNTVFYCIKGKQDKSFRIQQGMLKYDKMTEEKFITDWNLSSLKFVFVPLLKRWYIFGRGSKNNYKIHIWYKQINDDAMLHTQWTEYHCINMIEAVSFDMIVVKERIILMFVWEKGEVYGLDVVNKNWIKHCNVLHAAYDYGDDNGMFLVYDTWNEDIHIISRCSQTHFIIACMDIVPIGLFNDELVHGFLRRFEREYSLNIPHSLCFVIVALISV